MKNFSFFAVLFLLHPFAFAAKVTSVGEPLRKITASGVEVPVFEAVSLEGVGKAPVVLKLTGGGVREKKVVIASVNVYFLLSYTDLKGPLSSENPLKSFEQSQYRTLRMTFLRDVDAEKIRGSFSDALKENGVSLEEKAIQSVMSALQFDVKKGKGVDLIGVRTATGEKLNIVFPEKTIEVEGRTVVTDFWKIWFGKPVDGGMEDLKPKLIALDQLMHM